MYTRLIIFLFCVLYPFHAFSEERFLPQWKTSCKCNGKVYHLSFSSQSGDPTEDDMIIKFKSENENAFIIPLKHALYVRRPVYSDVKSICKDIGGFKLNGNRALLWISRDDRPLLDLLSLVLIDLKKNEVIDFKEDIGEIRGTVLVIRTKGGGYEIRLVREWLQNTDADVIENAIEDWMYIQIIDNKIKTNWSKMCD